MIYSNLLLYMHKLSNYFAAYHIQRGLLFISLFLFLYSIQREEQAALFMSLGLLMTLTPTMWAVCFFL